MCIQVHVQTMASGGSTNEALDNKDKLAQRSRMTLVRIDGQLVGGEKIMIMAAGSRQARLGGKRGWVEREGLGEKDMRREREWEREWESNGRAKKNHLNIRCTFSSKEVWRQTKWRYQQC